KLDAIMTMIQAKYGVTFNSNFFQTEEWTEAYLWYKNRDVVKAGTTAKYIDMDALISNLVGDLDCSLFVDLGLNSINFVYDGSIPHGYHQAAVKITSVSSTTVPYYVDVYVNGTFNTTITGINNALNGYTGYSDVYVAPNVAGLNDTILMKVRADSALTIDMEVRYRYGASSYAKYSCVAQSLVGYIDLSLCAPDMKIADFMSGILQEFNMVIENTGENDGIARAMCMISLPVLTLMKWR
ncbi:MAG: hypothetical protein EBZ62_08650, partial [Sphingobacteriia bacterium]|nr:hypothetical protein [Sphingobacteriia bacterium]